MVESRRRIEVVLPASAAGKRLDSALVPLVGGCSRTTLQRWIRSGAVRFDGAVVSKPGFLIERGGRVEIDPVEAEEAGGTGEEGAAPVPELQVVFEDEHLIAIDKPAGLLTHGTAARREPSVADLAVARFGPLPTLYGIERPGIVHRLDRETSGLLLLGRTLETLEALKRGFQERAITKTYLAIVRGEPRFDTEWIEKPLGRIGSKRDRISIVEKGEGREASTYYEVRERFKGFARLAVFPKTGRTHQVRVHLGSVGLPLLGEEIYLPRGQHRGQERPGDPVMARHALHAQVLELAHPATGEPLHLEAPVPADMAAALETLRLSRRGA
ncbi:MAG: RluA family pseudouridine synthase [Planctomycetota bacterium]